MDILKRVQTLFHALLVLVSKLQLHLALCKRAIPKKLIIFCSWDYKVEMELPISLFANISKFKTTFVFKKENKDNWRLKSFKFIYLIIYLGTAFPCISGHWTLISGGA